MQAYIDITKGGKKQKKKLANCLRLNSQPFLTQKQCKLISMRCSHILFPPPSLSCFHHFLLSIFFFFIYFIFIFFKLHLIVFQLPTLCSGIPVISEIISGKKILYSLAHIKLVLLFSSSYLFSRQNGLRSSTTTAPEYSVTFVKQLLILLY